MKIGILGGTFDPIHTGHLLLARTAQKQFFLDNVLFIPAGIPPHKSSRVDLTPAAHRYRMVELAIKNESGFEISDIELSRPGISYTVETLEALKGKYPSDSLYLIVGIDTLRDIPKWRNPKRIGELAEFLVAPRPGGVRQNPLGQGVQWIEMAECQVSASGIREMIASGKNPGEEMLVPAVWQYIQRMQLYRMKS